MVQAFKILTSDKQVKAILVNIFGEKTTEDPFKCFATSICQRKATVLVRTRLYTYCSLKGNALQLVCMAMRFLVRVGGIMKCDVIAQGIVNAAEGLKLQVPLVVRLEGTNVERGKEILKSSGMDIITADDLDDAASKAVKSIPH